MVGVKLHQRLVQERVVVLESMRLVDGERGPGHGTKERLVLQQDLVGRDDHVELQPLVSGVAPLKFTNL